MADFGANRALAVPVEPASSLAPTGFDHGYLERLVDELLINIRAGELRKVGRCLRMVSAKFLGETE